MAHLQGWSTELELRFVSSFTILILVLLQPGPGGALPARAQQQDGDRSARVTAQLQASLSLTRVHGDLATLVGGAATLAIWDRVAIGGGGAVLTTDRSFEGDAIFSDRRLGFGYGGLVVEVDGVRYGGLPPLTLRTLVGAGNAEVRDAVTGTRLGSDNAVVVVPEISGRRLLNQRLAVGLGLAYRMVFNLDDLVGVTAGDLRSISLRLFFRIGSL